MTYDQPNEVVKVYQDGEERTDLRYDYSSKVTQVIINHLRLPGSYWLNEEHIDCQKAGDFHKVEIPNLYL